MQRLKNSSSKWIKDEGEVYKNFYWQDGYGAFSVSPKDKEKVISYIANQHEHHKKLSFQEEYRKFLKSYKVDFDERFLWD